MSALLRGFESGYDRMNQHFQQEEKKQRYDQEFGMRKTKLDSDLKTNTLRQEAAQLEIDAANNKDLEQKFQAYTVAGDWAGMMQDPSFKDTNLSTIFNGVGRKAAIGLSQSLQAQDWQAATQHFNTLYKPKLNKKVGKTKGKNGGTILDVEATGFEVQPDGSIKIPVKVTTENGPYTSYISELRSGDKNDPAKTYSTEDMIGTAAGLGELSRIIESSGVQQQMQTRASDYYKMKNPQKPVKSNWELVEDMSGNPVAKFDSTTGELVPLNGEGARAVESEDQAEARRQQESDERFTKIKQLVASQGIADPSAQGDIADRVIELKNANPNMTWNEAGQQAISTYKSAIEQAEQKEAARIQGVHDRLTVPEGTPVNYRNGHEIMKSRY